MATEHPLLPGQLRSAAREAPETLQQGQSMSGTAEEDVPGVLFLLCLQRLMHFEIKVSRLDDHCIHTECTLHTGCIRMHIARERRV